jgi:ubiquinone/menaquinone biosynthesis C-methylase UbiE
MTFNSPVFVLTSDVDWASDPCIDDLAQQALARGITPVFMATGASAVLNRLAADGQAQVGWHPNFNAGSTHGSDVASVVEHVSRLFPAAKTFRSHSFSDSTHIMEAMRAKGLRYDSNICLHLQDQLVPLQHFSGLLRFPVFWEDDVHWMLGGSWDADAYYERFLTPGLKILNVHPINFALNVPSADFYASVRADAPALSAADLAQRRFSGAGTRTFVLAMLDRLRAAGHRFYTLDEVFAMVGKQAADTTAGRQYRLSNEEFEKYWAISPAERQEWLRVLYNKRNPTDRYATSRDSHLRELEIAAITTHVTGGRVLDLGCGNGYTLLSMAKRAGYTSLVGVDFADKLIDGAKVLLEQEAPPLRPEFVCADAVAYVAQVPDASLDHVITERFLLNLPDTASQHTVIREAMRALTPGGLLVMCEGSMAGFRELNRLRAAMGLSEIEERSGENVSAIRFEDAELESFCAGLGLTLVDKLGFRDYFVLSRVLHPLLVAPQPPRFDARVNELARDIQQRVRMSPEAGSNVVWVYRKPGAPA